MVVARVVAADRHPGSIRKTVHRRLAQLGFLRFVVVAKDLKRLEVIVHEREGVLLAWKVVERDIAPGVELFERVKNVETKPLGRPLKAGGLRVRMEVDRLHVKHARLGFELRLVEALFKAVCLQIKIAIPHLRLTLVSVLAGKIAPQGGRILLQDARHKTRANGQRDVLENFF